MPRLNIPLDKWQDYRGREGGIFVCTNTSAGTRLPVRDVLASPDKPLETEPNYETGTYGFISCVNSKLRSSAVKNRRRVVLFGTQYQGAEEAFRGKFLVFGYLRISKTLDVKRRHAHAWMERSPAPPECVDLTECQALYGSDSRFYAPEDCFPLTEGLMKKWGYKGRLARSMKLTLTNEQIDAVLAHFEGKADVTEAYLEALQQLTADRERLAVEKTAGTTTEEKW